MEVDTLRMFCGYLLMFVYTMFMLGRSVDRVEHRSFLALTGIASVGLGMGVSLGLTMALGYYFTTIHGILPFLALGIGIDDMFVIMQCLYNLSEEERGDPDHRVKIAHTVKRAGVAITVTSLTDVFAFGIGAVTVCMTLS